MITIITGTPGNGKTAHGIDLVWFKDSIWKDLEKYVDGVSELSLPHFDFPALSELKSANYQPLSVIDSDDYAVWNSSNPLYPEFVAARAAAKYPLELWFLWAQPNSVIFIDEAQRYFRPRPAGSRVPLYIQLLEYHRHFGVHFVLITQKERLIDSNVRMLTGQHIHITNGWKGRHLYEWPEVKDTDSKIEKSLSATQKYKLPVHVFKHYKSATVHLKTSHKTPFFFKVAVAAFLAIPLLGYFAYSQFKSAFLNKSGAPLAVAASGVPALSGEPLVASSVAGFTVVSSVPSVDAMQRQIDKFTPLVPARPETAPAYDGLRQVVSMPMVSACLASATNCRCYTQQGSAIYDMTIENCRAYLEQGRHFNPYAQPVQEAAKTLPNGFVGGDASGSSVDERLALSAHDRADR